MSPLCWIWPSFLLLKTLGNWINLAFNGGMILIPGDIIKSNILAKKAPKILEPLANSFLLKIFFAGTHVIIKNVIRL